MAQFLLVKPSSSPRNSSLLHLPPIFVVKVDAASKRPSPNARNPDFEPWPFPDEDDVEGWEEWFFQSWEKAFYVESMAYKRLSHLQGKGIPVSYGTGRLIIPESEFRPVSPGIILLEYIPDAATFDKVDRGVVDIDIILSLIRTVEAFGGAGVTHGDLGVDNALLAPAERPTRVAVLDFGMGGLRENESDEEWEEKVKLGSDVPAIYTWIAGYILQVKGRWLVLFKSRSSSIG